MAIAGCRTVYKIDYSTVTEKPDGLLNGKLLTTRTRKCTHCDVSPKGRRHIHAELLMLGSLRAEGAALVHPKQLVDRPKPGPRVLALQHGELLEEGEVLKHQAAMGTNDPTNCS